MMIRYLLFFTSFLLFFMALSGCGSTDFPVGTYTRQLEGQQISLQFTADGSFKILRNGRDFAEGTYSVNGDQLTWLTHSSCPAPSGETATYIWNVQDNNLTFTLANEDSCISRLYMLEKLAYEKSP